MMIHSRKPNLTVLALAALVAAGLGAALPAAADECDYTAEREAAIQADGVSEVVIRAKAGLLRITGRKDLTQVLATGEACASKESWLDDIQLTAERDGSTVRIEVEMPQTIRSGTARLDLAVEVPAGVRLDVDDSSGAMTVRGVGTVAIDDSSGEILVEDVDGDLRIEDSSGEIKVVGVSGRVHIGEDSSGEIEIRKVGGSVLIDEDSSGGIDISDVEGDVTIRTDSSGSISVRRIGGDFKVGEDTSGGIEYHDVAGQVSIPKED